MTSEKNKTQTAKFFGRVPIYPINKNQNKSSLAAEFDLNLQPISLNFFLCVLSHPDSKFY